MLTTRASALGRNMDMQTDQGPMLLFSSPFPSFSVTGRALSDQTGSFSLVPKNELHAS